MARKEIYICDHCGKEYEDRGGFTDTKLDDLDFYASVDLCAKCYNELCKIVYEFCKVGKEQRWRD